MEIPENVQAVLKTLESAGHEAWCVGGCVRDALLGRSPGDWDVTTSAQPEETLGVFGPQGLPTGLRHGTVTVKTPEGPVEVTTYRVDGAYRDHRRPESVAFTRSLDEDLARRDMDDVPIDESNYAELTSRIDAYISEFEEHGTDNILVDSDSI